MKKTLSLLTLTLIGTFFVTATWIPAFLHSGYHHPLIYPEVPTALVEPLPVFEVKFQFIEPGWLNGNPLGEQSPGAIYIKQLCQPCHGSLNGGAEGRCRSPPEEVRSTPGGLSV